MRRAATTVALLAAVALLALVVASALPSGSASFSTRALAPAAARARGTTARIATIVGSNIPARRYGSLVAHLENGGTNLQGQLVSDLSPVPAAAFAPPVAAYRAYAVRWSARSATAVALLRAALASRSRAAAEAAWLHAWVSYLHLGAVYGLIGTLDHRIDGLPGDLDETDFGGFHRLELGLWSGAPLRGLAPFAAALALRLRSLPHAVATTPISPLDYATRAHEILEDAQRDFLSGLDVPWSGEGVAATAAALAATREVITTLAPLMAGRDNTLVEVDNELDLLASALARIRTAHGGTLPTLAQLTLGQREELDATMAGALGQLDEVPGTLETAPLPAAPRLP